MFWLCLLLPFYAWIGYPLLLALLSLFVRPRPLQPGEPLSVSVIIAAHNEGPHIEHKLRTLLQQDYPATDLQIILASDGSSDDTV
ncbi:glycosyltransferase, partial [Pseudomonas protegens]|uniref:glycosyltransferase n=1 Tax=Pseudomonas protegens TaxID=380021 RepID=UPI000F4BCA65